MKVQLTQESKAALINAIHDGHEDYEMEWDNNHNEGLAHAISIIESFPTSSNEGGILVSDGGKPSASANWIPVSDEMNLENHEHVFVYKTGWKKPIPAIFIKMDKREDRFRSADAGGTLLEPTHYMKVHNPPTSHK